MIDITVSIVICGRIKDLLRSCLESLFENTFKPKLKVFLVDNLTEDDSVTMVQEHFPEVKVITNKECLGFAANNNRVIERAHGRYLLLLNPDTVLKPGTLDLMMEFMDEYPRAGVTGPIFLNSDGSLQSDGQGFPGLRFFFRRFLLRNILTNKPTRLIRSIAKKIATPKKREEPYEIDFPFGACLMVRHKAINDVGLMDTSYFLFAEEADWCKRMKVKGWKIYTVPEAKIVHYGGQIIKQLGDEMTLYWFKSHYRFLRRYAGLLSFICVKVLVVIDALYTMTAALIKGLLGILGKEKVRSCLKLQKELLRLSWPFWALKKK